MHATPSSPSNPTPAGAPLGDVAVVGLGLVGGSLALRLAAEGAGVRAHSSDPDDRAAARRAGLAVAPSAEAAVAGASLVVLAVPPQQLSGVVRALAESAGDAVLCHTTGLQRPDVLGLAPGDAERVLGTHPLAGSHGAGFGAARADLFDGALVSVEERAGAAERALLERLWRLAGAARLDYRTAEAHDRLVAWVSHLPQLVATALAATLGGAGVDPQSVGPGARDTTRLAASPFPLWRGLLAGAPPETVTALTVLGRTVEELRAALERRDDAALAAVWERARRWRGGAERPP